MNSIGFDRFYIKLVEEFPCENRTELFAREGVWIRELGTLNGKIEGRSQKEWREENREKELERHKKYREENREKELERSKKHYEENREAKLEYQKKYRADNRDKIHEKQNEKFECECGGKYTHTHKSRHLKSKLHQDYIANQPNTA